jgi:hypothetical protein
MADNFYVTPEFPIENSLCLSSHLTDEIDRYYGLILLSGLPNSRLIELIKINYVSEVFDIRKINNRFTFVQLHTKFIQTDV